GADQIVPDGEETVDAGLVHQFHVLSRVRRNNRVIESRCGLVIAKTRDSGTSSGRGAIPRDGAGIDGNGPDVIVDSTALRRGRIPDQSAMIECCVDAASIDAGVDGATERCMAVAEGTTDGVEHRVR